MILKRGLLKSCILFNRIIQKNDKTFKNNLILINTVDKNKLQQSNRTIDNEPQDLDQTENELLISKSHQKLKKNNEGVNKDESFFRNRE